MSSEFLTVEAVAGILQLHPKTLLRFIREGRLRATKVGKQYRILRSDLNAFAGAARRPARPRTRATSIVDIEDVDDELLRRLSATLLGAPKGNEAPGSPISVEIAHDPSRNSAKVIIIASATDAAVLLQLVDACLDP